MYLPLIRASEKPLWQQIVTSIIERIDGGELSIGTNLPPSRALALELGVSRSTIQVAYEELIARGYLQTSGRGGTKVIAGQKSSRSQISSPPTPEISDTVAFLSTNDELGKWLTINEGYPVEVDFRHQEPHVDERFKLAWRKAIGQAMAKMSDADWGYTSSQGALSTRVAIQQYLAQARGIQVSNKQIMITSGAQHSMDLIAQSILQPNSLACIEDPGFPGARLPLANRGIHVASVPVDSEGIIVDEIPLHTNLVFVTPSHQRPTGAVMSVRRRRQLLDFAVKNDIWIIEDDFDGEYRYHGGPLPSLYADTPSHVLYIMTLSKVLAPGIRLSVIVGPEHAIKRIASVQSLVERQIPIIEQLALGEFIRQGEFARHIHRQRKIYCARHQSMMEAIRYYRLDRRFQVQGSETGLHLFLEAEASFDELNMVHQAAQLGVGIYPLDPYRQETTRKGLLLGFAKTNEESIWEGIRRLEILC